MHSFRDLCLRVADRVEPDYRISVSDMTCCKGHQRQYLAAEASVQATSCPRHVVNLLRQHASQR